MARKQQQLSPGNRAWLNAEIDHMIEETGSVVIRDVANAMTARIRQSVEGGDYTYMPLVWEMVNRGVYEATEARVRQEHDRVCVSATTQRVIALPSRQATKVRTESGVANGMYQKGLWYEFSRAEFDEMVALRIRRHDSEREIITRFLRIQKCWDAHPEATNAVEAIAAAGKSLADFGIDLTERSA